MNKIYLGVHKDEHIYITNHSWDCEWYWSFGYIGNKNWHFHIASLITSYEVDKVFTSTKISQKEWYIILDLFRQAYTLKEAASCYRYGGHVSGLQDVTDCIKDLNKAAMLNKDLETLLNVTWEYLQTVGKGETL